MKPSKYGWPAGVFGCGVLAALLCCLLHETVRGQVESSLTETAEDAVPLYVDAVSFASLKGNASRLDIFIQVGYEALAFVKRDDKYFASYEINLDIFDSSGTLANEKLWTEEVTAGTFDESVSSQGYSLVQRTFDVLPGRYTFSITCRDNESKINRKVTRQIVVPDYATPKFSLSDIMLLSKLNISGDKKSIVPSVSPNVANLQHAFHIFFEAYNAQRVDTVRFVATVLNEKKEQVLESDTVEVLAPGRNQIFMSIDHTRLPLGDYSLFIKSYSRPAAPDGKGGALAVTSRFFNIRWRGMPRSVKDLDVAISQLRYIASDEELSHVKEGATPEERQKRFFEFWKKKDPNPNTPRNEKMEEYYAKVEYANKHFSHYVEGWRTDMGMVFIIFGAPNSVDRHPFEVDSKPYEVWSYYDLNHQFVFVDESGFGDYRLTSPIWDVWSRQRQ